MLILYFYAFSEEIGTIEEKVACVFNVAATITKWIPCILTVTFELMFMEVTELKP